MWLNGSLSARPHPNEQQVLFRNRNRFTLGNWRAIKWLPLMQLKQNVQTHWIGLEWIWPAAD